MAGGGHACKKAVAGRPGNLGTPVGQDPDRTCGDVWRFGLVCLKLSSKYSTLQYPGPLPTSAHPPGWHASSPNPMQMRGMERPLTRCCHAVRWTLSGCPLLLDPLHSALCSTHCSLHSARPTALCTLLDPLHSALCWTHCTLYSARPTALCTLLDPLHSAAIAHNRTAAGALY